MEKIAPSLDRAVFGFPLNGELVAVYSLKERLPAVLEAIVRSASSLIQLPPAKDRPFEDRIIDFQTPSLGPCVPCRKNTDLLGDFVTTVSVGSRQPSARCGPESKW